MELLGDGPWRMCGIGIDEPHVQMVYEDFFPGHEYRWTVWLDQIDLVTEGKAEITVILPPELERTKTFIAEAPCIYLIPRGSRITWRPLGDGPVPPHLDRLAEPRLPDRGRGERAAGASRRPRGLATRPDRRPRQRRRRSTE